MQRASLLWLIFFFPPTPLLWLDVTAVILNAATIEILNILFTQPHREQGHLTGPSYHAYKKKHV